MSRMHQLLSDEAKWPNPRQTATSHCTRTPSRPLLWQLTQLLLQQCMAACNMLRSIRVPRAPVLNKPACVQQVTPPVLGPSKSAHLCRTKLSSQLHLPRKMMKIDKPKHKSTRSVAPDSASSHRRAGTRDSASRSSTYLNKHLNLLDHMEVARVRARRSTLA
jgi:hypothetical protein